ncbi:short-chain dehydrogenase, putative [Perkinsus marinus ATCC 50983]|uniref:Short-chain dehydrogenase, putative n=1 Tax=Perkinsus marinus (strain ATCC 50983 / TXsc) TaxID=423536 RepID=C5LS61_PERM5|nr:short-chain dehydrogenase, putative [Perkinsus marinus ATCC 50983]EER00423.1 short-chain dehydrogenase, putative [Perkinsus marinus ATCC 50983]|eukprot:XP_002767705.1 short-chain dehydrogenase, putative [Perkinsus marinus ATCC 50983]
MSDSSPAPEPAKLAIVTGATAGIGLELAKKLLDSGWKVVVAARDTTKATRVFGDSVDIMNLDLTSFESVHAFASACNEKFHRIDRLILNGGVIHRSGAKTGDGLDEILQVNYFSNVLLMMLMLPTLRKTENPAVIVTNSSAHRWDGETSTLAKIANAGDQSNISCYSAYGASKLAMLAFGSYFSKRTGIKVPQCHPGVVNTNLKNNQPWYAKVYFSLFGISPNDGALPLYVVCVDPNAEGYFAPPSVLSKWFQRVRHGDQQLSASYFQAESSTISCSRGFWDKVWQSTCNCMADHVKKDLWEEALKNAGNFIGS